MKLSAKVTDADSTYIFNRDMYLNVKITLVRPVLKNKDRTNTENLRPVI